MAHGYDSDEIGELDEDDPRIFGRAELDRFGSVLEAFRAERRPEQYRTAAETAMGGANADEFDRRGRERRERDDDALFEDDGLDDVDMRRAKPLLDDVDEDGIERSKPAVPRITRDDVHDAFRAMVATRRRAGLEIPTRLMQKMGLDEENDGEEGVPHSEHKTKDDEERTRGSRRFELEDDDDCPGAPDGEEIEYLRNAPRERWDCETIVSTYSNLENHPSVIDEPHGGSGSGSGRGKRSAPNRRDGGGGAAAAANGPGASLDSSFSRTNGLPGGGGDYVPAPRRGTGRLVVDGREPRGDRRGRRWGRAFRGRRLGRGGGGRRRGVAVEHPAQGRDPRGEEGAQGGGEGGQAGRARGEEGFEDHVQAGRARDGEKGDGG